MKEVVLAVWSMLLLYSAEAQVTLQFEQSAYVAVEGIGVSVCVVLEFDGQLPPNVTVDIVATSSDPKTVQGSDYENPNPSTLEFPSDIDIGERATECTELSILSDENAEGNHTLLLSLANPTQGSTVGTVANAMITITDDDIVTVSLEPYVSVAEGSSARVLLRLDIDKSGLLECPVEVDFTTIDATASDPDDYDAFSGSIGFGPKYALMTNIVIPIVYDDVTENEETFLIVITDVITTCDVQITSGTANITIHDRERVTALISFVSPEIVVTEGAGEDAMVCVRLVLLDSDTLTGHDISSTVIVVSGPGAIYGVDFIAPGFWQVVFPEGAGNGTVDCFPVQIVDDDDFEERLEDFGVYIQSSSVSPESTLLVDPKFLTIRINDTEGDASVVIPEIVSVTEAAGSIEYCVNSGITGGTNTSLSLTLEINDGNAVLTEDFSYAGEGRTFEILFTEDEDAMEICTTFTIVDDDILEGDRDFTITVIDDGGRGVLTGPSASTITITDDETPVVFIMLPPFIGQSALSEGLVWPVLIEISNLPPGGLGCDVNVTLSVTDSSFKDNITFTSVTFASGKTRENDSMLVLLTVTDDDAYEEAQELSVGIASIEPPSVGVVGLPAVVECHYINGDTLAPCNEYTILDNNDAEVMFMQHEYPVEEKTGSVTVCVDSGVTGAFETALTVSLTAQDGTASVSADVSLPEPFQVVFSVGQTTSTSCTTISITSDTESEGDQSFTVTISSAGTAPYARILNPSVATVIIQEDDNSEPIQCTDSNGLYVDIAVPIAASIVVSIVSCLTGALLFQCFTKHFCHGKKKQKRRASEKSSQYEHISLPEFSNQISTLPRNSHAHDITAENSLLVTASNAAYIKRKDVTSNSDQQGGDIHQRPLFLTEESAILTSRNESYTPSGSVVALPIYSTPTDMQNEPIGTSANEAYSISD